MRVPDIVLRSIGFVGEVLGPGLSADSVDPLGTGFVVSIPGESAASIRTFCFVTAKHVLHGMLRAGIAVSVNRKDGSGRMLLGLDARWYEHPDSSVDLAVNCLIDPTSDISAFGVEDFFDPASKGNQIGPGDEVFFCGLFVPAPGMGKNFPLVRHGNLAMLPDEQIQTEFGFADVYLVEARSIGGISGSPVWVRETVELRAKRDDGRPVLMRGPGEMKLLGLMQAHWDVKDINKYDFAHDPRGVNLGVAIVVPAKKILEVINLPEMASRRREAEARFRSRIAPGFDSRQ